MPAQDRRPVYAYARWEVDLGRRELRDNGASIPIGGRAFDIMAILIAASGALVSKDELMAHIWPGAVVEENTLQVHISAVRKALGADRQMLKTSSGRGYRLAGEWVARAADHPAEAPPPDLPLPTVPPLTTNLPSRGTGLIGRRDDIRRLLDLASAYRIVTLTGPGGIGKTSLAIEVARGFAADGDCEVRFVELAAVSTASLVPSAIAAALGLRLGTGEIAPHSLAQAVGARRLLLVLDNCEHVIGAAAESAEVLVRRCANTSVIATSREILRVEGEYVYRVAPLDVPSREEADDETVRRRSAVELLVARTKALDGSFVLSPADLPVVSAVCRRLDGIPLAIEFAAARVATLGLQQVASRLDSRFGLLTGGRRTALQRHQTLRATLDWSYELLPDAERRLVRHLSIFLGGFTIDAAAAVVGTDDTLAVADDLSNLVSKSLVSLDRSAPADRWRLLETTRAYVLEKLGEHGEDAAAARRHAVFYLDLLTAPTEGARPRAASTDLDRFVREIDNVRAALDWCFSAQGDTAVGVVLTDAYVPVLTSQSLWLECREQAERALAASAGVSRESAALRLRLDVALGLALVLTTGPVERTRDVLKDALDIAERAGDLDAVLRTLTICFAFEFNVGNIHAVYEIAARHAELVSPTGDPASLLLSQLLRAVADHHFGRQREAQQSLERLLQGFSGDALRRDFIGFTYDQRMMAGCVLVRALWLQGELRKADELAQGLLRDAQASGNTVALWWALRFAVCPLALMRGDLSAVERTIAAVSGLATRQNANFWQMVARCFEGRLLIQRGEVEAGTRILRDALQTSAKSGWTIWYPDFLGALADGYGALGRTSEGLNAIAEAIAWAERSGERWPLAELLRIKGELNLKLGSDAARQAAGQCFAEAFAVAREQNAVFWELRIALSLARVRVAEGRRDEAREILTPVCERFTDGFETADLGAAKDLLTALST